jgi:hypothetical protein
MIEHPHLRWGRAGSTGVKAGKPTGPDKIPDRKRRKTDNHSRPCNELQ